MHHTNYFFLAIFSFWVTWGVRGQDISIRNTVLNSPRESKAFDVSHETLIFWSFSVLSQWGVGGQDIWAVNVLLAARDSDEEFDVFVTLPTVEEKANKRKDRRTDGQTDGRTYGRTNTPNYVVDSQYHFGPKVPLGRFKTRMCTDLPLSVCPSVAKTYGSRLKLASK
jgi:hypothetical protein